MVSQQKNIIENAHHNFLTQQKIHESVLDILRKIPNIVAYGMTGSGSTCFGIVKNLEDIPNASKLFDNKYFFL